MITKKNIIYRTKSKKSKKLLKGGANMGLGNVDIIKDFSKLKLGQILDFSKELYNYKKQCNLNDFESIFDDNISNNNEDINIINNILLNVNKNHSSYKQKVNIKIGNPIVHGSIVDGYSTVPSNCILCFNSLINTLGTVPDYKIYNNISFDKFIKYMNNDILLSLLNNLSLYSEINEIDFLHKIKGNEFFDYNNCFLNSMWYFPGQKYPKTLIHTDNNSFDYNKLFTFNGEILIPGRFSKDKINYLDERGTDLNILIDKEYIKKHQDGEKNFNILFFNLCREVDENIKDKRQEKITKLIKYELFLHYINLEISKKKFKMNKLEQNIVNYNYGDIPLCSSISTDKINLGTSHNLYYPEFFKETNNYCYNRVNVFLHKFLKILLIDIKLLEKENKEELKYFMTLSVYKQYNFINNVLKKKFNDSDYKKILFLIFKELNNYTEKYSYYIKKSESRNYKYLFEINYFSDFYKYYDLFTEYNSKLLNEPEYKNINELNDIIVNSLKFTDYKFNRCLYIFNDYNKNLNFYHNNNNYNLESFFRLSNISNITDILLFDIYNLNYILNLLNDKIPNYLIKNLSISYRYQQIKTVELNSFIKNHLNLRTIIIKNMSNAETITLSNLEYIHIKNDKIIENNIYEINNTNNNTIVKLENIKVKLSISNPIKNLELKDCKFTPEIGDIKGKYLIFNNIEGLNNITNKTDMAELVSFYECFIEEKLILFSKKIIFDDCFLDSIPEFHCHNEIIIMGTSINCNNNLVLDNIKTNILLIKNCNNFSKLSFSKNIKINILILENCNELKYLDISINTSKINNIQIKDCKKLLLKNNIFLKNHNKKDSYLKGVVVLL